MLRRSIVPALATASALFVAACSTGANEASPADQENETPPSSASTDPALMVSSPKNIKAITDACQLLTPDQLSALAAGTEASPDTTMYGESKCSWRNDNFRMTVSLNATTGTGPEKIYADAEMDDNFAPTRVDDYPAARVDEQSSLCRVEVGVAETESFAVNYSKRGGDAPEMQDPCGYAEKIASEVLKNIPNA